MGNFKVYRAFDEFLKDPNISLRAKGFLTMVLTNNITTGFEVEKDCSDSKEDIKDALLELLSTERTKFHSIFDAMTMAQKEIFRDVVVERLMKDKHSVDMNIVQYINDSLKINILESIEYSKELLTKED